MPLQFWKVTVHAVKVLDNSSSNALRTMGLLDPMNNNNNSSSRGFFCTVSVSSATPSFEQRNQGPISVLKETSQVHQQQQFARIEMDFVLERAQPSASTVAPASYLLGTSPPSPPPSKLIEVFEMRVELLTGIWSGGGTSASSNIFGGIISKLQGGHHPHDLHSLGLLRLDLGSIPSGDSWYPIRGNSSTLMDPSLCTVPFAEILIEFQKDPEEIQFLAQSFRQFAYRRSVMISPPPEVAPPPPPARRSVALSLSASTNSIPPLSSISSSSHFQLSPSSPSPVSLPSFLPSSPSLASSSLLSPSSNSSLASRASLTRLAISQPSSGTLEYLSSGPITHLEIPLIVFVNGKSGGKQGKMLISEFEKYLPKHQIFDILDGGPTVGLLRFQLVPNLRIIACGGDGTGRWILETLDKLKQESGPAFRVPPVGVIPLGTGNDIGRVIGWGGGYNNEPLQPIIEDMLKAVEVPLDRWVVEIEEEGGHSFTEGKDGPSTAVMNNYLCLGFADAKIALNFHKRREQNPEWFFNRNVNKMWYVNYGVREILKDSTGGAQYLCNYMTIEVDGRPISLPPDCEGIVVLNLPSYAGGMNLWGHRKEEGYSVVSTNDYKLELIGLRSVFHLGQIGAGLAEGGIRLAQGSSIRLTFFPNSPPMPGKIDGEPWLQSNGAKFVIRHLTQSRMLCKLDSPGCLLNPQMRGWLYKRRSLLQSWQLRWVVIHDHSLFIYRTRTDQSFRVRVDLRTCKVMSVSHVRAQECFGVTITATGKVYTLSVQNTGETFYEWVTAVQRGGATFVGPTGTLS